MLATLRVYLERYEASKGVPEAETGAMLADIAVAEAIASIPRRTGGTAPDVIT